MKKPILKQAPEAIVLGLVSGLVAIYFLVQYKWEEEVIEFVYIAGGIGLLSVLSKKIAQLVATAWMGLGQLMGKVVGGVLLSIVYLFILTPLARLQSIFSKPDKFNSTSKGGNETAWIERKHQFGSIDLEELW